MEQLFERRGARASVWGVAAIAIGIFLAAALFVVAFQPHQIAVAAGG